MAHVVAFAIPKGGSGKTTATAAVGFAAATEGLRVAILDSDSQGGSMTWAALAEQSDQPLPYEVIVPPSDNIAAWLRRRGDDYDLVLIDGDPTDDDHNRAAARAARLVVVPAKPGPADLVRVLPWIEFCRSIDKPVLVVLNQLPQHSADAPASREFLDAHNIPFAQAELTYRAGVMRSFGSRPGRLLTRFGYDLLEEITQLLTDLSNAAPEIRLSDAERDAALEALREHYAAGRLTKAEFDDRSAQVWNAVRRGELDPILADLPESPAEAETR